MVRAYLPVLGTALLRPLYEARVRERRTDGVDLQIGTLSKLRHTRSLRKCTPLTRMPFTEEMYPINRYNKQSVHNVAAALLTHPSIARIR